MFSLAYFEVSREAVFLTSLIFFLGGFRSAAIYSCRGITLLYFHSSAKFGPMSYTQYCAVQCTVVGRQANNSRYRRTPILVEDKCVI